MAKDAKAQIDQFFKKLNGFVQKEVPKIVRQTGEEYFKDSFNRKGFDGKPWAPHSKKYKPKNGSLMVKSSNLQKSITSTIKPDRVTFYAGNSKVPYARIHNEGGIIKRAARSEIFIRNRSSNGRFRGLKKKEKYKSGRGLSFKAYSITMPKRQFIGPAAELNTLIMDRIKLKFKTP